MTTSSRGRLIRRLTAVVFSCVLTASLTVATVALAATPASACSTTLYKPYKFDSATSPARITALVHNDNCQSNLEYILQRHRWYGWQNLSWRTVLRNDTVQLRWNCGGTGTYTYRTTYGNVLHYHNGPTARISC